MKDKFTTAENTESRLMTQLLKDRDISNLEFTPNGSYSQHDGTYTSKKGTEVIFEIKVRYKGINDFPTTVIEESKYLYMLEQEKLTGKAPYLFAFYPNDNKVLVTRIVDGKYNINTTLAPKQTCGNNNKINKKFVYIPINPKEIVTL